MITVAEMVRTERKGGAVTHLGYTALVSVCGRNTSRPESVPAKRLCKTCVRILKIDTTEHTFTPAELEFIGKARTYGEWAMIQDVVTDYENGEENSAQRIAMYRAALANRRYEADRIPQAGEKMVNVNKGSGPLTHKVVTKGATENQRTAILKMAAFTDSLRSQIMELKGKETTVKMVDSFTPELFDGMTRKDIDGWFTILSKGIETYKGELAKLKREMPKAQNAELKAGMYGNGEKIWKVQISKSSGHPYASLLTELAEPVVMKTTTKTHEFVYTAGAIREITPEMLLSLDDAKAFGRRTGTCCCCGRTLTKKVSIDKGIGPICEGGF